MGAYEKTFDWVEFPEGRARFAGGTRGWDERGHETFAVDVGGTEYFGEIKKSFLLDGYDFNIEIISFGYRDKNDVGMPRPGITSRMFASEDLETAGSLIVKLVQSISDSKVEPFVMRQTEKSHFKGKVFFRNGWALASGPDFEEETP